jgi:hypothetical protein
MHDIRALHSMVVGTGLERQRICQRPRKIGRATSWDGNAMRVNDQINGFLSAWYYTR